MGCRGLSRRPRFICLPEFQIHFRAVQLRTARGAANRRRASAAAADAEGRNPQRRGGLESDRGGGGADQLAQWRHTTTRWSAPKLPPRSRTPPPPCSSSSRGSALSSASLLWLAEIVVSQLRQPTPGGGLRRIGAQPLWPAAASNRDQGILEVGNHRLSSTSRSSSSPGSGCIASQTRHEPLV